MHDHIRGVKGAFRRLAAGVKALKDLARDYPVTGRSVVQKANYRSLPELIDAAIAEVNSLQENIPRISNEPADIPEFVVPDSPMAGDLPLSKEILGIIAGIINMAAKADSLTEALEIAYVGAGDISCAVDSKEGVTAFLEKRKPEFNK